MYSSKNHARCSTNHSNITTYFCTFLLVVGCYQNTSRNSNMCIPLLERKVLKFAMMLPLVRALLGRVLFLLTKVPKYPTRAAILSSGRIRTCMYTPWCACTSHPSTRKVLVLQYVHSSGVYQEKVPKYYSSVTNHHTFLW